jgi:hypothetical protein
MGEVRDPFAELGLGPGATAAEVRAAFWARARAMHPDRHPNDPGANERFRRVVLAYEDALRLARGLPPRRRTRVHHGSPPAAAHRGPPPVWRCPTCGDGYDYEDTCPRCESPFAITAAPPAAHALAAASLAIGLFVMVAGLRPFALGAMLALFGTFTLAVALHEKLRPALLRAS